MRVLEVTFLPPNLTSGGGMGIYQSMKSLLACAEMDYIGPEFEAELFSNDSNLKEVNFLKQTSRSLIGTIHMLAYGATTSFFEEWNKLRRKIDWSRYDAIHIEMSRYNFVVDEAKKHGIPVIIRLHNIEHDYAFAMYSNNKSIANYLIYKSYSFNEKKCIKKTDKLIFITKEDVQNASKKYSIAKDKIEINPVCISPIDINQLPYKECSYKKEGMTFLATGTLSFGPNASGIIWMIRNVWNKVSANYKDARLIIAGAHPSKEIREAIGDNSSIILVDTPSSEEMAKLFLQSDIYLAPIFNGAGMKVKIAEALSYGLAVIGTNHAWIGYDLVELGRIRCNTAQEFIQGIVRTITGDVTIPDKKLVAEDFYKNYSLESSAKMYRKILSELENGDNRK